MKTNTETMNAKYEDAVIRYAEEIGWGAVAMESDKLDAEVEYLAAASRM